MLVLILVSSIITVSVVCIFGYLKIIKSRVEIFLNRGGCCRAIICVPITKCSEILIHIFSYTFLIDSLHFVSYRHNASYK